MIQIVTRHQMLPDYIFIKSIIRMPYDIKGIDCLITITFIIKSYFYKGTKIYFNNSNHLQNNVSHWWTFEHMQAT